jgi:pimeloyl-ACP methyl ester carboxylesterase
MTEATASRIATPSGVMLAVYDWGGSGPPVLLCHPTGFHGRVWVPVAEHLVAAGRHVYSFDFRGHGDSDAPAPDCAAYHWDRFGDDALAVTRHLGLEGNADLVAAGHSKGATALLLGEAANPGTYTRIWAFEPIMFESDEPLAPSDDFPLAVGARRRRNEWKSRDEALVSYGSRPPLDVLAPESLRAYVDYGLRDRGDGILELKCQPSVEARVYSMGPANGAWARLPLVAAQVAVTSGEHSDAIPPRLATRIAGRLANSTLEIWEGHGHFGPQADPERAARSILATAS